MCPANTHATFLQSEHSPARGCILFEVGKRRMSEGLRSKSTVGFLLHETLRRDNRTRRVHAFYKGVLAFAASGTTFALHPTVGRMRDLITGFFTLPIKGNKEREITNHA